VNFHLNFLIFFLNHEKSSEQLKSNGINIQKLRNQKYIEAPGVKKPWWRM